VPRRNITLLLLAAAISWLCYHRATRNRYAATLAEAMNIVTANYVSEVEPRVLFEGAMDGMIGKLDPYSGYTSPDEFHQFQQQLEGEFVGVGIVVNPDAENGRLNVGEVFIGKPAYLAGIRAGDTIIAIDGQETNGLPLRQAIGMIRGKEGTTVKLRVQHAGTSDAIEHELTRATIPLETVLGDARDASGKWVYRLANHPRIGYIRIFDNFGERTPDEFRAALASYREATQHIDGLILDLRYNRGGLLEAARDICDMLLDEGTIVTTRGRHRKLLRDFEATPGVDLPLDVPIVVLVDRLSASASEIVAAALQDNHRAAVAGQRTWGKGTVQNVIQLEGGKSALRLTVGSYHRPSGKEIHKWAGAKDTDDWGVQPDPGLVALLTNRESELIILARRKRDSLPWNTLTAAPSESERKAEATPPADRPAVSNVPVPVPDAENETTDRAAALDSEAGAAAGKDPATIDAQLQRALDYLQQQMAEKAQTRP
jgi:carboxyl-terminal processing protease